MRWPLSTTSNPSFEPLTEALRGLTEGLTPRSTYDCKTMPEDICPTCLSSEDVRELYLEFDSCKHDVVAICHAYSMMRWNFSKGEKWTAHDEMISRDMNMMESTINRAIERAGNAYAAHAAGMKAVREMREIEAKAAATAEAE